MQEKSEQECGAGARWELHMLSGRAIRYLERRRGELGFEHLEGEKWKIRFWVVARRLAGHLTANEDQNEDRTK
jgi:hypothetical protein